MLAYNELKPKVVFIYNDQPHMVVTSDIAKRTKQKPVNQAKIKNLITGATSAVGFRQSDKFEPAELDRTELEFAYQKANKDGSEFWFVNPNDPSDRQALDTDTVGEVINFLRPKDVVTAVSFDDQIISLEIPIKMNFKVKSAPPNIKGNTSAGGNKVVVLETGYNVTTPLFIESGDTVEINTETGEYVTRVEKG